MSEQLWQRFVRRSRGQETIQPCEREMKELLDAWDAPQPPRALDESVMAAYRARFQQPPFWRRVFAAEIRLPVPAAAAFALLCCGLGWLAFGQATTTGLPPQLTPAVETKVIEVPVVRERIVTRTVYVVRRESPARRAASALAAHSQTNQQEQQSAPAISLGSQVAGDSAYTSVNLAGFQPVDEIKATVIKGRNNNER